MKKLICLISSITLLNSCDPKSMPEGYWIDFDKKGLITFNSEGEIVVVSEENRIITKDEFEVKNVEPNFFSFIPKDGSETVGFYKASETDFLLGNWYRITENNRVFQEKFTYSSADEEWSFHETDFQKNETTIAIVSIVNDDIITLNSNGFNFNFSKNKDSLTLNLITNDRISMTLVRGTLPLGEDYTALSADESDSKNVWKEIESTDFFNLNSSNQIQYKNQPIQGEVSVSQESIVKISPTSKNDKFAVVYIEENGLFLCDLETMTSHKLDIYSPYTWLSWSPESDFVIFYHYYEADGTLYSYNLSKHELTELSFSSEYNIDSEQLIFDIEKLKWFSPSAFEIPVTVNCNPYNSETNCDELGHEQVLRSKTYRYNVKLGEIVETK